MLVVGHNRHRRRGIAIRQSVERLENRVANENAIANEYAVANQNAIANQHAVTDQDAITSQHVDGQNSFDLRRVWCRC